MIPKKFQSYNVLFIIFLIFYAIITIFRYPFADELTYLQETSSIYHHLLVGQWIGNENVGLHGFIFKFFVALLFFITGPSIYIATLSNSILACASLYILTKILKEFITDKKMILILLILLFGNYHFYMASTTYIREMPALFSMILFAYFYLKNKSGWLIGFSLLLLMDAKEHVFYQIAPGLILWSLICLICDKKYSLKKFIIQNIQFFSPSLLFVLLMLTSSLVPLNIYQAYILSLTDGKSGALHSSVLYGGNYMGIKSDEYLSMSIIRKIIDFLSNFFEKQSLNKIFFSYWFKILYPRVFSYIASPHIIVLLAIYQSLKTLLQNRKSKEFNQKTRFLGMISSIFISFTIIYFFRKSHGRYFITILPIALLLLGIFWQETLNNHKKKFTLICICILFLSVLYEVTYIPYKFLIQLFVAALLLIYIKTKEKWLLYMTYGFVSIVTFSAAIASNFTLKGGQLINYINYGKNIEIEKILPWIKDDDLIFSNFGDQRLYGFYKGWHLPDASFHWRLQENIPKKKLIKNSKNHFPRIKNAHDYEKFISESQNYNINKFILSKSTDEHIFHFQKFIKNMLQDKRFRLLTKLHLKGRTVFIFTSLTQESNEDNILR